MLSHTHRESKRPRRVVLIGCRGFAGRSLSRVLRRHQIEMLPLSSDRIDLCAKGAVREVSRLFREGDAVVIAAGMSPRAFREPALVVRNAALASTLHGALDGAPVSHVVYLSSDAVYPAVEGPISERTCAESSRAYGMSHRLREVVLSDVCADRLVIVRSTMLYGVGDPHGAYGPNRMAQSAVGEGVIRLFGRGEDVRDYLAVTDLARLLFEILCRRSLGVVNAASGHAVSAAEVASLIEAALDRRVRVAHDPRPQPASRRTFDVGTLRRCFPGWKPLPLSEGMTRLVRDLRPDRPILSATPRPTG